MENSHSASYAAAGVDIEAGYKGVKLMSQHVARTVIPGVVSNLGGFGGLFAPDLTGMSCLLYTSHCGRSPATILAAPGLKTQISRVMI